MKLNAFHLLALAGVAFAALSFSPDIAQAKRGIIPYHNGEKPFPTGPIPEEFASDPELKDFQAGYKCNAFGIVWTEIWISDCEAIAYKEEPDSYSFADKSNAPELIAAIEAKYTESDMDLGLWGRWGKWLLLLIALGLLAANFLLPDSDEEEEEA